ncbi:helix-turn-helix domain-containing protein [Mycobacteroides franklinii]|uniref:helix-turn-helix domain-containing protein n=1 Tax=Mycobacteroides franklinii TaxID=948102 RepID=UPI001E2982B3|nr:LysR family transcriptional regulator [Mycobacteroides franklinii]
MNPESEAFYTQYVTHHRTLPDIAQECGITPANLGLRAKALDIPIRGRGGPSHRANLAAADTAALAPAVIRPALAEIGGRDRLERFADASRYRTLTIAAERLGIQQFTLVNQINRIERELGTKLLIRAERGRPMRLTDDGARIVAVIRACQRRGWKQGPAT